jgi:hypothetical protein
MRIFPNNTGSVVCFGTVPFAEQTRFSNFVSIADKIAEKAPTTRLDADFS